MFLKPLRSSGGQESVISVGNKTNYKEGLLALRRGGIVQEFYLYLFFQTVGKSTPKKCYHFICFSLSNLSTLFV